VPFDPSRVRALCFDVDGTLSDTDDLYTRRLARCLPRFLCRERGRAARRIVMWSEAPGNALLGLSDRLGLDGPIVVLIDWIHRHQKRPWREFLIVPGVSEMLARLQAHYPMAIVSARDENSTLAFLQRFDLTKYFEVIITALSAPHTKPYPDPIRLAAQRIGVAPEACLMIGDTTVDIRAGRAAGAQTVGVLCGFGEEGELRRAGADLLLASTAELDKVLLPKEHTSSTA